MNGKKAKQLRKQAIEAEGSKEVRAIYSKPGMMSELVSTQPPLYLVKPSKGIEMTGGWRYRYKMLKKAA